MVNFFSGKKTQKKSESADNSDKTEQPSTRSRRFSFGKKKSATSGDVAIPPTLAKLPVEDQGVVVFTLNTTGAFDIIIRPESSFGPAIELHVNPEASSTKLKIGGKLAENRLTSDRDEDKGAMFWVSPKAAAVVGRKKQYWVSLNRDTREFKFGTGLPMAALALMRYSLGQPEEVDQYETEGWVIGLRSVDLKHSEDSKLKRKQTKVLKLPVTTDFWPVVLSPEDATLEGIAKTESVVISNLNPACQSLYQSVAGPKVCLNTEDFPDFSDAINYSLDTEGALLYNKLKSKSGEFGTDDAHMTYIRVTLGVDRGDSPGVPYVLEIWPKGNYSPIHHHSDASAIIKVLHGSIEAHFYRDLDAEDEDKFMVAKLEKDEVTWIAPDQYQVHRLSNTSTETMCATIQCYKYAKSDNKHYETFDYINEVQADRGHFLPTSDFDFLGLKKLLKEEYAKRGEKPEQGEEAQKEEAVVEDEEATTEKVEEGGEVATDASPEGEEVQKEEQVEGETQDPLVQKAQAAEKESEVQPTDAP